MNRRNFIKGMLGGTALSVVALSELNAEIYKNLKTLNLKYLDQQSPDGVYWDAVRKHYMMENGLIMMNNGTVGPIPKPVLNTFNKWVKVQATNPYDVYSYLPRKTEEVRKWISDLTSDASSHSQKEIQSIKDYLLSITMPIWQNRTSEFRERKMKRSLMVHG